MKTDQRSSKFISFHLAFGLVLSLRCFCSMYQSHRVLPKASSSNCHSPQWHFGVRQVRCTRNLLSEEASVVRRCCILMHPPLPDALYMIGNASVHLRLCPSSARQPVPQTLEVKHSPKTTLIYEKKNAFPCPSRRIFDIFSSKSAPASYSFQRVAGKMCLFFSYHLLSTTFVIVGSCSLPSRLVLAVRSRGVSSELVPCGAVFE